MEHRTLRGKIKETLSVRHFRVVIRHIENLNEKFDTILESVNLARKLVKEQGGLWEPGVYKEEMRAKRDDAIQITGRFYGAMQQGELEVYLQPKFNLEERKIYGQKHLARWRTKTGEIEIHAEDLYLRSRTLDMWWILIFTFMSTFCVR